MRFFLVFLLSSFVAKADVLLSVTAKYGANGYDVEGSSSTTTSSKTKKHHSKTYTTTTGSLDVDNRVQLVPGLMIQTMPEKKYDLSIGAGVYMDSTFNMFVGMRL